MKRKPNKEKAVTMIVSRRTRRKCALKIAKSGLYKDLDHSCDEDDNEKVVAFTLKATTTKNLSDTKYDCYYEKYKEKANLMMLADVLSKYGF